jgi:NosR/NirI family transcriptional regulator, nitrous oxide reductase regulator
MRWFLGVFISMLMICAAQAGEMTREKLAVLFPAPMTVGELDADFPVWPIFNGGATDIAGWAFETTDLAPIPGFSGTPPDLLVVLAPDGTFLDVKIISHHEPIFLDGLGEEPLFKYVEQYRGLTLGKPIKVGSNINAAEKKSSGAAYINGILKATASVLIINQTVLASAIKVAKAKLGIAGASANTTPAKINPDIFEKMTFAQMLDKGLVQHVRFSNAQVETLFKGSIGEELDEAGLAAPDGAMVDLYVTDPMLPTVGRNLMGDAAYAKLVSDLPDGQPAIMVISAGRWSVMGDDWTPGSVPDRLIVKQSGLPIVVRDMAWSKPLVAKDVPSQEMMILKVPATAGFDPASAFDVVPHITRAKGIIYPELASVEPLKSVQWPASFYIVAKADESADGWRSIWAQRSFDLTVIAASLLLLTVALALQKYTVRYEAVFKIFRFAFLTFTLVFIGWHAQAQLSVVTLIGLVKAVVQTHDFSFLLWDPPSLLLWAFTIVTFVVWGRGTFCGWLCPFGALQELVAEVSRILRIRQWRVPEHWDVHLRKLKYVTLAVILVAAVYPSSIAEKAAEVEPFKTSITLLFVRFWPFVVYAVLLIVFNLFVYKAFCRYLCPLGAMMAIGGKLRLLNWIPRRVECGSPCQLCKVKCRYGAIEKTGAVNYTECFQCLDCVEIIGNPEHCVPDMQAAKRRNVRTLIEVPA